MNTLDNYADYLTNAIIGGSMCKYEIVEFQYDETESIEDNFVMFVRAVNDERRNFNETELLHLESEEAKILFEKQTGKKL